MREKETSCELSIKSFGPKNQLTGGDREYQLAGLLDYRSILEIVFGKCLKIHLGGNPKNGGFPQQNPWGFPTKNDHFGVCFGGTTILGNPHFP